MDKKDLMIKAAPIAAVAVSLAVATALVAVFGLPAPLDAQGAGLARSGT